MNVFSLIVWDRYCIDRGNAVTRLLCGLIDIWLERGTEPVDQFAKPDRQADVHDRLVEEMRGQVAEDSVVDAFPDVSITG